MTNVRKIDSRGSFIAIALVAVVAVSITTGRLLLLSHPRSSIDKGGMYIGVHTDTYSAWRIALRQMNSDALRHPEADVFTVWWTESRLAWLDLDEETDRHGVEYIRKARRLMFFDSGGSGGFDGVSPAMLAGAAKSRNPWHALEQYGCATWP